jgi:DNA-directed RNA polymerase alpha subunit
VDPDCDGEVGCVLDAGRTDDVEVETVLGLLEADIVISIAEAMRRVCLCVLDAMPGCV